MTIEKRMTAILDEAQIKALPKNPTNRSDVIAYCNAAINSGCGAFARHYGDGTHATDLAIFGVLSLWIETIKSRLKDREAAE